MSDTGYTVEDPLIGKAKVHYRCPRCAVDLESLLSRAGVREACPHCSMSIIVPGSDEVERRAAAKKVERDTRKAEKPAVPESPKIVEIPAPVEIDPTFRLRCSMPAVRSAGYRLANWGYCFFVLCGLLWAGGVVALTLQAIVRAIPVEGIDGRRLLAAYPLFSMFMGTLVSLTASGIGKLMVLAADACEFFYEQKTGGDS